MGKEIIIQVQETQRIPNRINPRWNTPKHILIKLTKIKHKEQILKAAREKQWGDSHKDSSWSFNRNSSARREWQHILRVMKEKNLQPRWLYPARISFKYEEEFKSFTDKQQLIWWCWILSAFAEIYATNIGALQYVRQMLTSMKGEINNNTIIVGDFNTHSHLWIDQLNRKLVKKHKL